MTIRQGSDDPLFQQADEMEIGELRLLSRRLVALHRFVASVGRALGSTEVVFEVLRCAKDELGFEHVEGVLCDGEQVHGVGGTDAAGSLTETRDDRGSLCEHPKWESAVKRLSPDANLIIEKGAELYFRGTSLGKGQRITLGLWSKSRLVGWCVFGTLHAAGYPKKASAELARLLAESASLALENVEERERARKALLQLTQADAVTGVPQRREFELRLREEWARLNREGGDIAAVLVDVDGFQSYAARYGNAKGDVLLRRVAQCLRSNVFRPADYLGRYGGDEFAVILPNTSLDGAEAIADRLRRAVSAMHIEHPRSEAGRFVTISLGVAGRNPKTSMLETLLGEAEQALYLAKVEGGDRVIVAELAVS